MSDHTSEAVSVHAAADRRLNPDRRRNFRVDGEGAGVSWKGLITFGSVLGVLILLWGLFRAAAAVQDAPAKIDSVIAAQKVQIDSTNSIGNQVRTLSRDLSGTTGRVITLEQQMQGVQTWRAGIDQLKETRAREMTDFEERLRSVELRRSAR